MSLDVVDAERTKLLASALNTACTSCFTVGIATPLAGYVYNVSGFRQQIGFANLALGGLGWLGGMIILHLLARRVFEEAGIMNEFWWLAFVITPVFVVALGYGAVRLHEWDLDRRATARGERRFAEH